MSNLIKDYERNEVFHDQAFVDGVRLYYTKAGSGDPAFLLHGVPKTSCYQRHVTPLLTPRSTVIAPNLRELRNSQHPNLNFFEVLSNNRHSRQPAAARSSSDRA